MKNIFVFHIYYLILFIIFESTYNIELTGVFRIDSVSNGNTLTDENYRLQFDKIKEKASQNFRIVKTKDNLYYIETKSHIRISVNENGHVILMYDSYDKNLQRNMEWNIILLEDNKYAIQNNGNKKFLEMNNNFLQCINDLPQPIEQHKYEIANNFKFILFKLYEELTLTKEQKDIFFLKMKKSGFEWDEEKKELKNLEKKNEQKLIWDKFDDLMLKDLIEFIESGWSGNGKSHLIYWLKSIKDRINNVYGI